MKTLATALLAITAMLAVAAPVLGRQERDCDHFSTQRQAQRYFERHGGSPSNNVDRLDADGDGRACESLPGGGSNRRPSGENEPSGGDQDLPDTATRSTPRTAHDSVLIFLVVLAGAAGGTLVIRRRRLA